MSAKHLFLRSGVCCKCKLYSRNRAAGLISDPDYELADESKWATSGDCSEVALAEDQKEMTVVDGEFSHFTSPASDMFHYNPDLSDVESDAEDEAVDSGIEDGVDVDEDGEDSADGDEVDGAIGGEAGYTGVDAAQYGGELDARKAKYTIDLIDCFKSEQLRRHNFNTAYDRRVVAELSKRRTFDIYAIVKDEEFEFRRRISVDRMLRTERV